MTKSEAIKAFELNLKRAEMLEYVHDKVAWALYQTWRIADKKEKEGKK